jgi:hypothetical protein
LLLLGTCWENILVTLGTHWKVIGTPWEHFENLMGTFWEQKKKFNQNCFKKQL